MLNVSSYTIQPIYNCLAPFGSGETPKGVFLSFDFTAQNSWDVELRELLDSENLTSIQSLFYDNQDTKTLLITSPSTGLTLRLKGNTQGYVPFCLTADGKLNFTCIAPTNPQKMRVALFNVPFNPYQWSTT